MSSPKLSHLVPLLTLAVSSACFATTADIRVATYNIEADVSPVTTANSYMEPVLEAIGNQTTAGVTRPLDILGLEETTSNSTTVAPMVAALNSHYGANVYAQSSVQATQQGGATGGNGPNALIYNTTTLQLIASVPVSGTPTSLTPPAGQRIFRQVMRYEFIPVGGTLSNAFYVYVSHMKSSADGETTNDAGDRNTEATAIRNDEASLPASSSVLFMGDYNMSGTAETGYKTITDSTSAGTAVDPLNPTNAPTVWASSNKNVPYRSMITESTQSSFDFRDDLQLMTQNVFDGSALSGLSYIPGSEHAFGNTGAVTVGHSYFTGTAPPAGDFSNIPYDLSQASDHLPVVADYAFSLTPIPEPASLALLTPALLLLKRRKK